VFTKQLGAHWARQQTSAMGRVQPRDRQGGDPAEWPDDLQVREWPSPATLRRRHP
jgi:hypothetical protein